MQDAVVDMDPISLIITSLDVKGVFPNIPHRLLQAVWKHMRLPFWGFLQAYLATRMYTVKTDVGTTPWVHPSSGVPQGGAEGPFLFLLVTLLLALYIRRTYPDVAPYPLRTTLLAFADDMAVVTPNARQPLSTTPDPTRATKVLHAVTSYLEGNQLLVHNVTSATMVQNAPRPPLRPGDPPMNPVNTATYLEVQQAATANTVTLPPNLIRQLTRTLVIARMVALSTQALVYFLQTVLNAAIGFQALHLTHPQDMLQAAATTVRRAWIIHGHRPTSLPAAVRAALPPYYGDNTDHLVNNAYTAHPAADLRRLMHNHEPEVREVFTLTLREAQYPRNTCPQYILHQRGLSTKVGTRIWNQLQLLLPQHQHVIQTKHRCREAGPVAVLHTDVGGGPTGSTTPLDLVGTNQHLVRVTPNQMRVLQRVGTHHVPFLQHPEWPDKSVLESRMRSAATQTGHPQPTDGKYVRRITCFGARTSGHCHQARHEGTRPTTGHQSKWSMYQAPRCQQYSSWHPTDLKPHCDLAEHAAACGCCYNPRHAPSVCYHCRRTSWRCAGDVLDVLEMWTPSTSHPVAPPPVTGALPPHTNGPRYPGTTRVATHALRTGRREGHGHCGVRPQRRGGMEIPPGNVGHQAPSQHLPGAGQTPQCHARGPRLPG